MFSFQKDIYFNLPVREIKDRFAAAVSWFFFSLSGLTESLGMLFKLDVIFLTRMRKGQEGASTFKSFAFF